MVQVSNPDQEKTTERQHQNHVQHYAVQLASFNEIRDLIATGFEEDDIRQYAADNPTTQRVVNTLDVVDSLTGPMQSVSIYNILRKNAKNRISENSDKVALAFVDKLGRRPDMLDLFMFVSAYTMYVALARRAIKGPVDNTIESGLCNALTGRLIEEIDPDLFCSSAINFGDQKQVEYLLSLYNPKVSSAGFEPIQSEFLQAKMDYMANLVSNTDGFLEVANKVTDRQSSPNMIALKKERNDEFGRYMRKIRQYGVKPVSFDFSTTISDVDAVYDNRDSAVDVFGKVAQSDNTFALMRITSNEGEITALDKFIPMIKSIGALRGLGYKGLYSGLAVDNQLGLQIGMTPGYGTVSAARLLEIRQKSEIYEDIRAHALANLFDSIAPASLVNHLTVPTREAKTGQSSDPSDIVYDMALPRMRLIQGSPKEIKQLFDEADRQETQQRLLRLHGVTAHLRLIPATARASQKAIIFSKEEYGDDYEIPEGYTFIKKHNRGNAELGAVVGHTALQNIEPVKPAKEITVG